MYMKTKSTYRMYIDSSSTEYTAKGSYPAKAMREMAAAAGITIASQDGRYGKTTDGHSISAMTATWGRTVTSEERTTRTIR